MFIIDIISMFSQLDFIIYLFVAFAFFGVNLCAQKLIFGVREVKL